MDDLQNPDASASSGAEEAEVGRRIRRVRLERGLTLRQLEELADLSDTHLSDIERGRTSPTLGALMRIATALGREPGYFVDSEDRAEVHHLPIEACRTIQVAPGIELEILTLGVPGSRMLAYRLRFDAGVEQAVRVSSRVFTAEGIYVVWQGSAEILVDKEPIPLGAWDALQAAFTQAHRLRALGTGPSEVLLMGTDVLQFAPAS